jgi:hypothetical protein
MPNAISAVNRVRIIAGIPNSASTDPFAGPIIIIVDNLAHKSASVNAVIA